MSNLGQLGVNVSEDHSTIAWVILVRHKLANVKSSKPSILNRRFKTHYNHERVMIHVELSDKTDDEGEIKGKVSYSIKGI